MKWPFKRKDKEQAELESQAAAVVEFAKHLADEMRDSIDKREAVASFPQEFFWAQIKRYFLAKGLDCTALLDESLCPDGKRWWPSNDPKGVRFDVTVVRRKS